MLNQDLIAAIDAEWNTPGFFGQLRSGRFDPAGAKRVKKLLLAVPSEGEQLPRRLVALTWGMPAFMRWQRDVVAKAGGPVDELDATAAMFQSLLEQVLGVP